MGILVISAPSLIRGDLSIHPPKVRFYQTPFNEFSLRILSRSILDSWIVLNYLELRKNVR